MSTNLNTQYEYTHTKWQLQDGGDAIVYTTICSQYIRYPNTTYRFEFLSTTTLILNCTLTLST